jgi:hypothetical protein
MNPNEKLGLRIATGLASVECNRAEELRRLLRDVVHDLMVTQDSAAPISFASAALVIERDEWRRKYNELKGERLLLEGTNQELRDELKAIREAADKRIAELTQKLEALTPEPWQTVKDMTPPVGVQIMVISQVGWSHWAQLHVGDCLDWIRHWRCIPSKLYEWPNA